MCDITINELDNQAKLAFFKTICLFEFPEFDAHFTKREDNNFDIPVDLEIMLKSVSISTARGVVFSELRGTYLHGAILPLIDIATPVKLAHEQRAKISLEG